MLGARWGSGVCEHVSARMRGLGLGLTTGEEYVNSGETPYVNELADGVGVSSKSLQRSILKNRQITQFTRVEVSQKRSANVSSKQEGYGSRPQRDTPEHGGKYDDPKEGDPSGERTSSLRSVVAGVV